MPAITFQPHVYTWHQLVKIGLPLVYTNFRVALYDLTYNGITSAVGDVAPNVTISQLRALYEARLIERWPLHGAVPRITLTGGQSVVTVV